MGVLEEGGAIASPYQRWYQRWYHLLGAQAPRATRPWPGVAFDYGAALCGCADVNVNAHRPVHACWGSMPKVLRFKQIAECARLVAIA